MGWKERCVMAVKNHPGSFRDPNGFLFTLDNVLYRQINPLYTENYRQLMDSGLYKVLEESKLLIPHTEADIAAAAGDAYMVIKPQAVPFISYPYEWSFLQLKEAALCTLKIQKVALEYGMSLKDATAYNIQFVDGRPILIDTLSFEKYVEGNPWVAYNQFCRHFLAPVALMALKDLRLSQLLRVYIDGVPLDLASSLLPKTSYLRFSTLTHIHLHARFQKHYGDKQESLKDKSNFSRKSLLNIIDSLESALKNLKRKPRVTEWADYYDNTNYTEKSHLYKKKLVEEMVESVKPQNVWDLGSNTGFFSRIASRMGISTVSFDIDPECVERNYEMVMENSETKILPLVLDLTNPSSSIGWENNERMSFTERGPVEMVFALALIHHLAISNNVPLGSVAHFFSGICKWLVIEFVPKSDSQVKRLLATREDVFPNYKEAPFEEEFGKFFEIVDKKEIAKSQRTLYLMKKK